MAKTEKSMPATELLQSEAQQSGRRLILRFMEKDKPVLDRIEFVYKTGSRPAFWQRGDIENNFGWTEVPQALALVFLDYVLADPATLAAHFSLRGEKKDSLAASLGNAIYQPKDRIHGLFVESVDRGVVSRVQSVFGGDNIHGKLERERRIQVRPEFLPQHCVEIYWEPRGSLPLTKAIELRTLLRRIQKSLGMEVTAPELEVLEEPPPKSSPPPPAPPPMPTIIVQMPPAPSTTNVVLPNSFLSSFEKMADAASNYLSRKTEPPPAAQVDEFPKTSTPAELPRPQIPKPLPSTPVPPIDPQLFEITNPHHYYWEDNASLLDLGDNDDWQIKDACEGVLIMGAPGSGKTSGSGFAIASAFLMSGFGGLVLCAKTDEARRWQKLCSQYKREQDCIVITRDSPHKLNILAYETFRPRIGLTDDLITFFRELISIVSRRSGQNAHEDFWINATNQLMRALFDVFLLAREPITVDNLVRFVTSAPESPDKDWGDLPYFADVMDRAEQSVQTDEDRRVFSNAFDYWANVYPGIAPMTRSGITLGFTAMADALKGRGIHALISTETTLTPESILSGKIVILDLPLKECGQGGMLVQAAWKYLFQRAVERRADKGQSSARPVFLWEDEAHLFFSQHDVEFQPTARDCRAAHVLISQSLHNFYQLGHNPHAVQAVLATLNTQIFHANGDLETNKWASEKIGTTLKMHVSISIAPEPQQGFWDQFRPHKTNATTSLSQQRESVLQPEAFLQLKKGGDGITQAVILWVSHAFASNKGQPFTITTFEQQPIL